MNTVFLDKTDAGAIVLTTNEHSSGDSTIFTILKLKNSFSFKASDSLFIDDRRAHGVHLMAKISSNQFKLKISLHQIILKRLNSV